MTRHQTYTETVNLLQAELNRHRQRAEAYEQLAVQRDAEIKRLREENQLLRSSLQDACDFDAFLNQRDTDGRLVWDSLSKMVGEPDKKGGDDE